MLKAKCILIGKSPYNENDDYKLLVDVFYPTKNIAFFPEVINGNYNLYNLTTYRRILSFLHARSLTEKEFNNLDNPKSLVRYYLKKGIYFINQSEIKIKNSTIQDLYKNDLFSINDTTIICFGDDAFNKFKDFKNIIKCPHPSKQVSHKFWEKYDNEYRKDYNDNFNFQNFFCTLK